ncbi:type II toxin-antitoxin system RelE/ParE family toxin [Candidatus Fermentibacteria bacterium]|nr:type II toxin-antitoxin system RelE/ParE family toxin [Candidatus Fermentibacteria bacterium]
MATYRVEWKASAVRELTKLDRPVIPRVAEAVSALASNPLPRGARKLHGGERTYRIRVGEYRVVYVVRESERVVEINRVRHRRDVYRP